MTITETDATISGWFAPIVTEEDLFTPAETTPIFNATLAELGNPLATTVEPGEQGAPEGEPGQDAPAEEQPSEGEEQDDEGHEQQDAADAAQE